MHPCAGVCAPVGRFSSWASVGRHGRGGTSRRRKRGRGVGGTALPLSGTLAGVLVSVANPLTEAQGMWAMVVGFPRKSGSLRNWEKNYLISVSYFICCED